MKTGKLSMMIIIIALLLIGGCNKSQTQADATPSPSNTEVPVNTSTSSVTPSGSNEELAMEAYEKFLNNEASLSFDRYMQKGYFINPDNTEEPLFQKGTEYTLSEILKKLTAYYLEHSDNKKINYIDYAFIDCGKDGEGELLLRFNGMDIDGADDNSTLVYVIKYIDGKLYLCYYYETWARSETSINEYGFITSSGSGGASLHITDYSFIDKNGNWRPIVYVESELNINTLQQFENLTKLVEAKGVKDIIQLDTIRFDYDPSASEQDNGEVFYTFYVYNENWEPVEDANLYTDSVYKKIFEEANVSFITPDELSVKISEKEQTLGVTAEIKEGAEVSWKTLKSDIYSDYVES